MIIVNYEYEPKNQLNKRAGTFDYFLKGKQFGTLYVVDDILDYKEKYKKHKVIVKCMNCGKVFETYARNLMEGKDNCGKKECRESIVYLRNKESMIKRKTRRRDWNYIAKKRKKIIKFLTGLINYIKISAVYDYEVEEIQKLKDTIDFLYYLDRRNIIYNSCPICKNRYIYDTTVSIDSKQKVMTDREKKLKFRLIYCPVCGYAAAERISNNSHVDQRKETKDEIKEVKNLKKKLLDKEKDKKYNQ